MDNLKCGKGSKGKTICGLSVIVSWKQEAIGQAAPTPRGTLPATSGEYLPNVVTVDDRDARRPGCACAACLPQWRYDDLYPTVHVSNRATLRKIQHLILQSLFNPNPS